MNKLDWTMNEVWNTSMSLPKDREESVRTHLWASELEKPPVDLWLRFRNTPTTNPPNGRSIMKFKTGELFEWWMGLVLRHSGILQSSQEYCKFRLKDDLLEVSGKSDFIAGGKPNLDSALEFAKLIDMPVFMVEVIEHLVKTLTEKYPDGLGVKPIEIKSVSSFVMNKLEKEGAKPLSGHKLQLSHYIIGGNHPQGLLTYVCRDDLRMKEFDVFNNEETRNEYEAAVKRQTDAVRAETQPEKEKLITFEDKFNINYGVAYSGYLTMLYGFQQQMEYEDTYRPKVAQFNRVLKRMKDGAKMTPKNELILVGMREQGFKPEELVSTFSGESEEETETE